MNLYSIRKNHNIIFAPQSFSEIEKPINISWKLGGHGEFDLSVCHRSTLDLESFLKTLKNLTYKPTSEASPCPQKVRDVRPHSGPSSGEINQN